MAFVNKVKQFFWTTFIGGMLVILPIAILVYIVKFIIDFIVKLLRPLVSVLSFDNITNQYIAYFIAFAIVMAFFFVVGLAIRTQFGKRFYDRIEDALLERIPFYNTIKETLKQFFNNNKSTFSKVVLVDAFGNDTRMVGFVADEYESGNYAIFVPTGPNPTNGFVFHVKKDQVTEIDVKPEDAMRTIIGVGTGSSELFKY